MALFSKKGFYFKTWFETCEGWVLLGLYFSPVLAFLLSTRVAFIHSTAGPGIKVQGLCICFLCFTEKKFFTKQ